MPQPKVLIWDIETGFNLARIFSLFNKYKPIPHTALQQERYMISMSWKELGSTRINALSLLNDMPRFKTNPHDDYHLVKACREVLSEADALVAHYGDSFDLKFFNARLLINGLAPLPPVIHIDTYKIAKRHFLLNSNRLDYIGQVLGLGGKIHTTEDLWHDCFDGKVKAVREMVRYNKQDVALLEKVYQRLAPFTSSSLNMNHFFGDFEPVCPTCGDDHLHARGKRYTKVSEQQRFQCQACKSWSFAPIRKDGTLGKLR